MKRRVLSLMLSVVMMASVLALMTELAAVLPQGGHRRSPRAARTRKRVRRQAGN